MSDGLSIHAMHSLTLIHICGVCTVPRKLPQLHMRAVQVESDTFRDKILGQSNV